MTRLPAIGLFCLLFSLAGLAAAHAEDYASEDKLLVNFDAPWDQEMIDKFARFPVQDGGRVKPFDTVARYALLRIHGRQSIKFTTDPNEDPTSRSATEWALYALFAPDSIKDLPLFILDDSQAAITVGMEPGEKRDRYSYNEIVAHEQKLEEKAMEFSTIDSDNRTRIQKMVLQLHINVIDFKRLTKFFEFALEGIPYPFGSGTADSAPEALKPDSRGRISVSGFLNSIPEIKKVDASSPVISQFGSVLYQAFTMDENFEDASKFRTSIVDLTAASGMDRTEVVGLINSSANIFGTYIGRTRAEMKLRRGDPGAAKEMERANEVAAKAASEGRWKAVQEALRLSLGTASFLTIFPPPAASEGMEENDWFNPTDLTYLALRYEEIRPFAVKRLALLESLAKAVGDKPAFSANAEKLFALVKADAGAQFDVTNIEREVKFFKADYFTYALVFFIFAFLLVIISFLAPGAWITRILSGPVAVTSTVAGLGYLVWGIVQRCLIMDRPPVGTLYETNLFIAATAVFVGLIIEYFNRRRLALLLAAFVGAGLLFVANRFHLFESKDTMDPLLAVLRTNFWLSVHVTTVCMGYSAGLVAALIGYIYVVARFAGVREQDDIAKEITRMAYGVVCFGMLFSLFGTVTGGIWANDSWGRFWGWDPKENGAFMIVLWNMVILHSRLGGYARQLGIHVLTIFGGALVAFSWWHVNQLEVGLHSYGFTDGIMFWLIVFYGFTLFMLVLCSAVHIFKNSLANLPASEPSKKVSAR